MLKRLKILLPHDFRLQRSYGIIAAYSFVIFGYAILLYLGRDTIPEWFVAVIIYTDPSVLGFFFLGGLMMLEKSENVRVALAMTPISSREYLLSKYLTLTALALIAVTILALLTHSSINIALLVATVIPTSLFFVSLGALIARRAKTVTAYLIGSLPILLPIVMPMFLVLIDPYPIWINLIPTTAQFWLVLVAMGTVSATWLQIISTLIWVIISAILTFWLAQQKLQEEFGEK